MKPDDSKKASKTKLNLTSIKEKFTAFTRHISPHIGFVVYVLLLLGITFTVFSVGQTLGLTGYGNSSPETGIDMSYSAAFDQPTIQKIRNLSDTTGTNVTLPGGRINPFAE